MMPCSACGKDARAGRTVSGVLICDACLRDVYGDTPDLATDAEWDKVEENWRTLLRERGLV